MTQPITDQLEILTTVANDAGADGIWLIRGADYASMRCVWPRDWKGWQPYSSTDELGTTLVIEQPHELIVLIRFPINDGQGEGVEHR